jgi:glutamine amidotransferase
LSSLAIIDSGGANIASVKFACQRLGADPVFTADPAVIFRADRVILPGVGAAAKAMVQLEHAGLVDCIRGLQQPVLGICLGMQLLYESSAEGETPCLGIIPGTLQRLAGGSDLRVPHMGWNELDIQQEDPLLAGLAAQPWFYFVHSYAAPLSEFTVANSHHGQDFTAVVRRGNFCGVQFHPERSADQGARLLRNFLAA